MNKTIKRCLQCGSLELSLYMGGQFGKYECKKCGYIGVLVIEEEVPSEIPAYYRTGFDTWLARLYDVGFQFAFFGRGQKIRELVLTFMPARVERVLDMATGTGDVALTIKKHFPKAQVFGIDLSKRMIDIADKKARQQGLAVSWMKQNIEKTTFKSGLFDAVTISFAYHELPPEHRPNVLKESCRLLKKNGRLILLDFDRPKNALLRLFFALFLMIFEEPYAKTLLDQDLVREFKKAGFRDVSIRHFYNHLVQVAVGTK